MTAGGLPTVQVLLDDGTGTFPYDITAYARLTEGYTFTRGRQDELSAVTTGGSTLVLDNADGRFTVGSTLIASPSPIKTDRQIRVKVTANATTVNRFTHYVQNWPTEWPSGDDQFAVAAIGSTDAQAKAERRPLRSVVEEEILHPLNGPAILSYLPLSEPAGAVTAADFSGYNAGPFTQVGSGTAISFGTGIGPATDGLTAAVFTTGGRYLTSSVPNPALRQVRNFAVWFVTTAGGTIFRFESSAYPGDYAELTIAGGVLVYKMSVSGVVTTTTGTVNVADGLLHAAALIPGASTYAFRIDGATTDGSGIAFGNVVQGAGTLYVGGSPSGPTFGGTLAHIALHDSSSDMTSAVADTLAASGTTGFAGESDTARITRTALGYAGIPLGTLDASLTNVAFEDITGKSAWQAVQDVADAAMGVVFVDGSGNLTFYNRNRPVTKTSPDVTIDANFLAEGTRFEYDMQGVLNYLEVTAAGTQVTQVARNTTSEVTNKHGRYPDSKSYLVRTDQEALDLGNWTVSTHAEPAARVGSLVIDVLTMTAAQQASMLAVEADTWLRVTGLPGQTPGGTTADFIVQGLAELLNAGEWTLTLNAANKPALFPTPWILDDATWSVLDSTTRVFV